MRVRVGDIEFEIAIADNEQNRMIGLSQLTSLPKGKGLLMKFESYTRTPIRMSDMNFPLDLIFIKDNKVIRIKSAQNGGSDIKAIAKYDSVLEINLGEGKGINVGDDLVMLGEKNADGTISMANGGLEKLGSRHLLDEDGNIQMNLLGAERVFSREDTNKFFKYAKNKDFKKLGKAIVDAINRQDSKPPEYSKN